MILTGKQPEEEQQPVESVKLETGTRLGTVKLTVDGKTTDNILIKGLAKKNLLGNLNDKYAAKDHKHKEYLKPSEVNITGTGLNGEVVFTEATPPDTTNGTLTLKMKEGQQFERIIDLPFTGLKHLAFADKLTSYPDEMASSFYNDMCTDLNQDLEFVSTTRSSTINGGSLTIASSGGQGGDLICGDITASGDVGVTGDVSAADITATGNVTAAGFVVPNTTDASTKFLLANGGVDSYGRDWYMKRGSAITTGDSSGTYWLKVGSVTINGSGTHNSAITLLVGEYYLRNGSGILEVSCRKNSGASTINTDKTKAVWICRDDKVVPENYVVTGKVVSSTQTVFNLYCKLTGTYKVQRFAMLDEGGFGAKSSFWDLYDVQPPVDNQYCFSAIPSDETASESIDTSYAAIAGNVIKIHSTGTCTSGAGEQHKVATVDSSFTLLDGATVSIKFANTNTYT